MQSYCMPICITEVHVMNIRFSDCCLSNLILCHYGVTQMFLVLCFY